MILNAAFSVVFLQCNIGETTLINIANYLTMQYNEMSKILAIYLVQAKKILLQGNKLQYCATLVETSE